MTCIKALRIGWMQTLTLLVLAACASNPKTVPGPQGASPVPPQIAQFSNEAAPVKDFPRIASKGGCEPTYRNGNKGACVADKPCRGYGVRNDQGQDMCECYLAKTGCDAKSRCDLPDHACVPDDESTDDGD